MESVDGLAHSRGLVGVIGAKEDCMQIAAFVACSTQLVGRTPLGFDLHSGDALMSGAGRGGFVR